MFLAQYRFTGPTDELVAAYDRMRADFRPTGLVFHACVEHADGITVIDGCPDRPTFEALRTDPRFVAAVEAAGLPTPSIEPLGEVHVTVPSV